MRVRRYKAGEINHALLVVAGCRVLFSPAALLDFYFVVDGRATWADIGWLKTITSLPILVKVCSTCITRGIQANSRLSDLSPVRSLANNSRVDSITIGGSIRVLGSHFKSLRMEDCSFGDRFRRKFFRYSADIYVSTSLFHQSSLK